MGTSPPLTRGPGAGRHHPSPMVTASGVSTLVDQGKSAAPNPVRQRYPVRRQATSVEGSQEGVRQSQKVRHVGVKDLSEYARWSRGAPFPSKLDVASSSLVSRSIASHPPSCKARDNEGQAPTAPP
jgi:hypothetical protein